MTLTPEEQSFVDRCRASKPGECVDFDSVPRERALAIIAWLRDLERMPMQELLEALHRRLGEYLKERREYVRHYAEMMVDSSYSGDIPPHEALRSAARSFAALTEIGEG